MSHMFMLLIIVAVAVLALDLRKFCVCTSDQ